MRRHALVGSAACVTGVLAISAVATQFVAGWLGYRPVLGTPWSWIGWLQAPWALRPRATFGMLDGALLGVAGLAMAAGIAAAHGRRRRPQRPVGVHGTARFLTEPEIRRSGLLPAEGQTSGGIYLGAWADGAGTVHNLRHDGPEHCIVIAPPRSGKGVGNILPTLLSWPASALIYDEKGELWQLTAG